MTRLLATLLIAAFGTTWASAGPDYEAQLGHSVDRWVSGLELTRLEGNTIVTVTYLCRQKDNANALAKEFGESAAAVKKGKWLGYSYSVSAPVILGVSNNTRQWVRRQFFIGVAYECDMDRLHPN